MKQTKASILYFMGPAMLLFCLIFIYPVSRTAIMSFFSVKSVTSAVSTWSWAGLDNYIKLFHTAIHFMAYDRITIRNNIFTITSDSEQIDRYGILADTYGSFIDPTGAESTTDFTIEGNTFDVSDPKATVLEITTNNKSPKHIKNVTIKDNTLKGVNGGKAIDLYLLDNCTISGNTIEGFERPIVANSCDEQFISDTDIVTE